MSHAVRKSPDQSSFAFVQCNQQGRPVDPEARRTIRKQAMKDVAAARRQRGDYGKHNLVQYPSTLEEEGVAPGARTLEGTGVENDQDAAFSPQRRQSVGNLRRPRPDVVTSCQLLNVRGTLDSGAVMPESLFLLIKLIPFTGLRLGLTHCSSLPADCRRGEEPSPAPNPGTANLASFLPSRYYEAPSLRSAVDCLAEKLRQLLLPTKHREPRDELILRRYNKAILNDSSNPVVWLHHVAGAARLLELRGPERFETDFELALLMVHVGPTVMEAFVDNKACFLAEDRWQQVLRQAVFSDNSLACYKSFAFSLWSYLVHGPGLFKETTDIVCSPSTPRPVIEDLMERLLECRIGLLKWLDSARMMETGKSKDNVNRASECWILEDGLDYGNIAQLTLRGTFIMCLILKTRLLYALAPSQFPELELECQILAQKTIESEQHQGENQATWTSFRSQSAWLAKGILATKQSWGEVGKERDGVIEKWKFEAWCKAIGRKCPQQLHS